LESAYIFGLNQKKLIRTNNITVKYGEIEIKFPNINLDYGGQLLIIGKSGSGKTSLLNILGGLLSAESGNILVNDIDLFSLSNKKRDKFRGQQIGFVFQTPHFIKSLSVNDNLKFSQYMSSKINQSKIDMLLKKVDLNHLKNASIQNLSEGEKQRISIIRALVNQPSIIFADEPTSALDDSSCNNVVDLLTNLSRENNTTLVIVTHDKRIKDKFPNQINLNDF
jgi:putative ABC transport system ATP-binding protein